MTDTVLLRKEVITHVRLPDGSVRITKVIDRKVSPDFDRMKQSTEVEIL